MARHAGPHHVSIVLGLSLVALALACLAGLPTPLNPSRAEAETSVSQDSDPLVMGFGSAINYTNSKNVVFHYMLDQTTGRIAYCKGYDTQYPPNRGTNLPYMGKCRDEDTSTEEGTLKGREFDYVIYHGYAGDTSITIGSVTGDANLLYLATQLAIYDVIQGSSDYSDTYFATDSEYRYVSEAANQLYEEAVAYATAGGGGVEEGFAIWYDGPNKAQDIVSIILGGSLEIQKVSSDPNISTTDAGYSLAGAEFKVYSDSALTQEVADLTTDATGITTATGYIPYGTYWVREVKAPEGFILNDEPLEVQLASRSQQVSFVDQPLFVSVDTVVSKVDAELGTAQPLGGGRMSGALFFVAFYAGAEDPNDLPRTPTRSWTLETDKDGYAVLDSSHKFDGDAFYTDASGKAGLPMGVVVVREVSAPTGYQLPDNASWTTVVSDEMAGQTIRMVQDPVLEQAIRGDVSFEKQDTETEAVMPGVVFRVTSETTGESHIIMTDENGAFSSSARTHSSNVNALDVAVSDDGTVDESKLTGDYGTWFYGYRTEDGVEPTTKPNDELGALPYDTYDFQELASSAMLGHDLTSFTVTVTENGVTVDAGIVEDTPVTISTLATDTVDKFLNRTSNATTIEDEVSYTGLTAGNDYTLVATLVDGSTGNKLYQADGQPYTTTTSFRPSASSGTKSVYLELDPSSLNTSKVVVFERLINGQGALLATHEDLTDGLQAVYLPRITTTLVDQVDNDHLALASSLTSLTDTVSYEGLYPGGTYVLEGTLVDRDSGLALVDGSGNEVTTSLTFVAQDESGMVSVPFSFDTTTLGGRTVVAYERLSAYGTQLCAHEDLTDSDQSVSIERHDVTLPNTGSSTLAALGATSGLVTAAGLVMRRVVHHVG